MASVKRKNLIVRNSNTSLFIKSVLCCSNSKCSRCCFTMVPVDDSSRLSFFSARQFCGRRVTLCFSAFKNQLESSRVFITDRLLDHVSLLSQFRAVNQIVYGNIDSLVSFSSSTCIFSTALTISSSDKLEVLDTSDRLSLLSLSVSDSLST